MEVGVMPEQGKITDKAAELAAQAAAAAGPLKEKATEFAVTAAAAAGPIAAQAKVNLGPGVMDAVRQLCADKVDDAHFGNARYTRSLFEDGYANMAARAYADGKIDRDEIENLVVEDIPHENDRHFAEHHRIGFRTPGDAGAHA